MNLPNKGICMYMYSKEKWDNQLHISYKTSVVCQSIKDWSRNRLGNTISLFYVLTAYSWESESREYESTRISYLELVPLTINIHILL